MNSSKECLRQRGVHAQCSTTTLRTSTTIGLPKLRHLDVSHTPLSDIGAVATMPGLEVLYLRRTLVRDLSPCAPCRRLRVLDISQTQV
jgi:Leucine-rich repeat (LRR) protein